MASRGDKQACARSRIAAVILAGGRATRCGGGAKGLMEIGPGASILSRMIEEIRGAGIDEIAISANEAGPYAGFGLPIVPDIRPRLGPIGGIEAGLAHFRDASDAVLFLPCDLPGITVSEITALLSAFAESGAKAVFAKGGDYIAHPLCAVVHNDLLPAVSALICKGCRKVTDAWARLGAVPVLFEDAAPFCNVNTVADLVRWKEGARLRPTILVPQGLSEQVEAFLRSEGIALEVVVVDSSDRAESDESTLRAGGWIKCGVARALAEKLGIGKKMIGRLLNLLDIRVRDCELGCF